MSKKKELLYRAYIVLAALVIVAVVLIGSTVKISVIEGNQWREKGDSSKLKYFDIAPDRGNIYSADNHLLATSVPYFDLHMDLASEAMTDAIFEKHVDSLAIYLSKYVYRQDQDIVKRKLIRRRKAKDRYFLLKNNATYQEMSAIKKYPLIRLGKYKGGLIIERESKRLKPYGPLAFRTIGLDRENAQSVGLEGSFDEFLHGEVGRKLMQKVGNHIWVPVHDLSEIKPQKGKDIVTTLNMEIQDIGHTALHDALVKHDADFGLAVVMEVNTGAIRAIVNLDKQRDGSYTERFNHAVGDATEPGSTFKLASVMALLEDGLIELNDSVNINHGRATFGKFVMKDAEWRKETKTTIRHAFEISSNVGIAKVVRRMYGKGRDAELYIAKLHQFGLHKKTGIEILGEGSPFIKEAFSEGWSKVMSLPWMAHGYELSVTPMQTLAFFNAVANNGVKMKPYLVDRVLDGSRVIKQFKPKKLESRIASQQTIALAKELLEGVVANGTARSLRTSAYKFAGKSGTTKLEYWKNKESKYQPSFVGYFPAKEPKYSCIVMVNNPKKNGYYGGTVAGRIFREIADKCMATDPDLIEPLNIVKQHGPASMPMFEAGFSADLKVVLQYLGIQHIDNASNEWAVTMPGENVDLALENRIFKEGIVPNVKGMGIRDAIFVLENMGMSVKINGYGKVKKQSVEAGTKLTGQKILLSLG